MSLLSLGWAYFRHRVILICAALAIALGIGILYTVLAVFNGFLTAFEDGLRAFSGDVSVQLRGAAADDPEVLQALLEVDGVDRVEQRLYWFAMVGRRGARNVDDPRSADLSGLLLVGLDDSEVLQDATGDARSFGELLEPRGELALPGERRTPIGPPVVLGKRLAEKLGLGIGDPLEVFSYHDAPGSRPTPVRATFVVAGHFSTGRYDLDLDRLLVRRTDLAALVRRGQGASELLLFGPPRGDADALAGRAGAALRGIGLQENLDFDMRTWRALGSTFLLAAENQKGILATIFAMIVLVAAYQLVATLLLTVAEKRRDMGVLGALGASPGRITGFFVGLGLLITALGCAGGLALGAWLVRNLEVVERWIGGGRRIFVPEIYKFETIPVAVDVPSTALVVVLTLLVAALFSLLPAWRAARLPIVRALRPR